MDWSAILGQLARTGASTATMDVAYNGLRQPEQRFRPPQFVPNPILQQKQAVLALLAQHRRDVNVATLDLVGVWINPEGFWMHVTRGPTGFIYVGRDILNNVCENGMLRPAGNSIVCPNLVTGKTYRINLINMQGQMVYTTNLHSGESFSVPPDLSSGMYLMQILEDQKLVASGKVIVKH